MGTSTRQRRSTGGFPASATGLGAIACGWIAALALLTPGVATADDASPTRLGPYVTFSALYVTDLYEDELEDALSDSFGPIEVDIDDAWGFSARAGVRFLPFAALELQYDWLEEYAAEFDLPGVSGVRTTIDVEQQSLTANLRLIAPIGRVQPYVLAGIGFARVELDGQAVLPGPTVVEESSDDVVLAGRVAVGLELYLTDHVALAAEGLVLLTDEEIEIQGERVDHIFYAGGTLGLTYRF